MMGTYAILLLIGIVGFILLITNDPQALKLSEPETDPEIKQLRKKDAGWFLSSPCIIIFYVVVFLHIALMQLLY